MEHDALSAAEILFVAHRPSGDLSQLLERVRSAAVSLTVRGVSLDQALGRLGDSHVVALVIDARGAARSSARELTRRWVASSPFAKLTLIVHVVSADSELGEISAALAEGAVECVSWPSPPDLCEARLLALFRREAALRSTFLNEQIPPSLRLAEQRYRSFISQSTEGIWRAELREPIPIQTPLAEQISRMYRDGYMAECNDAMAKMYGFTRADELTGVPLDQLLVRDDPRNTEYLSAFIQSHYRLENAESQEVDRSGNRKVFSNSLVGVVEEGMLLRAWGTQRDITGEVEARLRIEGLADRLRQSEMQLRSVVENIPAMAFTAGPDGAVEFFNKRWYEYTGTTFEQSKGWGWLAVHHPDWVDRVNERWMQALTTGEPGELEFPVRSASGQFQAFLTLVIPLKDEQGRVIRWFGTMTNVDEQSRQRQELQAALQARDTFLSIASHELRTPLTPLGLKAKLLERALLESKENPLAVSQLPHVHSIQRQIQRLGALVNELLDVSRISGGRLKLNLETVELGALVREVASRFQPEAEALGSRMELRADDDILGHWDRLRLEQVVCNLLSNALKYGQGGLVTLEASKEGSIARLKVQDQGIGIEPEALDRIFGKFERAVSERHFGGMGLGLYVTRQIVLAMGGEVFVQSQKNVGSTFVVSLPLTPG